MDLTHDWRALNEVFFPKEHASPKASTLVILEEGNQILNGVISHGAMFSDQDSGEVSKAKLDALSAKYHTDRVLVLSKKNLDQAIIDTVHLGTNYFQQLELLRSKLLHSNAKSSLGIPGPLILSRSHFVLDLFSGKVRRLLPRRFNFLVYIDHRPLYSTNVEPKYQAILLSYSDGQLDLFFEPDFSSLHENRLSEWKTETAAIGQYLESRYMLPCYGIFMSKIDWEACLEASQSLKQKPWRVFSQHVEQGQAAVYPAKNLVVRTLLALQRMMVYFGGL